MKDFTTDNYINPIIQEIKALYTIVKDNNLKVYFDKINDNCKLLLCFQNLYSPVYVNSDMPILPKTPQTLKALYREIDNYSSYAATYTGELDQWNDHEKDLVLEAIKQKLLSLY